MALREEAREARFRLNMLSQGFLCKRHRVENAQKKHTHRHSQLKGISEIKFEIEAGSRNSKPTGSRTAKPCLLPPHSVTAWRILASPEPWRTEASTPRALSLRREPFGDPPDVS